MYLEETVTLSTLELRLYRLPSRTQKRSSQSTDRLYYRLGLDLRKFVEAWRIRHHRRLDAWSDAIHPFFGIVVWIFTTIWAGVDASKIELSKYKVRGPASPLSTVLGCLALWIVVFPWYIVNKGKIARGATPLKSATRPV